MYTDWRIASRLGTLINDFQALPEQLKRYIPDFEYLLYDLSNYTDEEIKGIAQTRIGLTLLRDIFTSDIGKLLSSFKRSISYLNKLEDKQTGMEYFETMMRYIASAAKCISEENVHILLKEVETNYQEGSDIAMTLADMWRREGIEQGMEQGIRISLLEMADQALIAKFKKVPSDITDGLKQADIATLKAIVLKVLSNEGFTSLEEVREYL